MGGAVSSKTYGVVTPDILTSYDGLAFLKAIVGGTVPNPPISELMGFHLVEVEKGRAVFEGVPEFATTIQLAPSTVVLPRRCSIRRSDARSFRRCTRAIRGPPSS